MSRLVRPWKKKKNAWSQVRLQSSPVYGTICGLIKTRLRITANVITNEGNRIGSNTYSDKLSTNCWCLRIFFYKDLSVWTWQFLPIPSWLKILWIKLIWSKCLRQRKFKAQLREKVERKLGPPRCVSCERKLRKTGHKFSLSLITWSGMAPSARLCCFVK